MTDSHAKKTGHSLVAAITTQQVEHVAQLAAIPLSKTEARNFTKAFDETLHVITNLQQVDVSHTSPTHQVTGLENVWRDDLVKPEFSFSQAEALANAAKTADGYFVVPQVISQD